MKDKIFIIGGGIASLTAASYLVKKNYSVTILEKSKKLGGLVGSFNRKNFLFDSGIRAIENSGVLIPMLRDLGIDLELRPNNISIIIENNSVKLDRVFGLDNYEKMLIKLFPESKTAINKIIVIIKEVSKYMDVLYGIDNPLFLDIKRDKNYFIKTIIPWMFKYKIVVNKIQKLDMPVNTYLKELTENNALIDMIVQHFFSETPTFFALSYFRLYTDYYYPKGGIQSIIDKLEKYIVRGGGKIINNFEVTNISLAKKEIIGNGISYEYDKLIWGADLKTLYSIVDINNTKDYKKREYYKLRDKIKKSHGNDSLFTLYVSTLLDSSYYKSKCSEHNFYTPEKRGLSSMKFNQLKLLDELRLNPNDGKKMLFSWIDEFVELTTYEISIPVLRDKSLAPNGESALIISTVFSYDLTNYIKELSIYDEFKKYMESKIIEVLNKRIFKGLEDNTIEVFSSTPLTIEKYYNNSEGAITGWSFKQKSPTENRMKKIAKSVETPFKDIYQAGHWTFSPSGFPVSIITGKIASDKIK